ncbi:hypothetical protein LXL04_029203 [Taraxacum kok-saghyz]
MAMMSSSPPLRAGDIYPPPPPVHSTTASTQLVTKSQLPRRREPIHLSEKINHLCQLKNLTGALTLLHVSPPELTETAKATGILLQACGGNKDIETGRKVHQLVSSSTHLRNNVILNTQLSQCTPFADLPPIHDWFSNNYRRKICINGTQSLADTLETISACIGASNLRCGQVVQGLAVKLGLISDVFVGNVLVAMYGKFGFVDDAVKLFDEMPQRNLVTWNTLISSFSDNGYLQKSIDLFMEFLIFEDDLTPDVGTLVTLLPICASERDILLGKTIHSFAVKLGLYHDPTVQNALMDMYSKNGYISESQTILHKNKNKNVVSWNSIIWGCSQEGEFKGILGQFKN